MTIWGFTMLCGVLIGDEAARRSMAQAARRTAAKLPRWDEALDVFETVLKQLNGQAA